MDERHRAVSTEELLAHASFLRRVAGELVRDPHDAADLVQDTWIAALEHPPAPGPLRGWLVTVARRMALNRRRGDQRRGLRERAIARPERVDAGELALERIETQRALFDLVLDLSEVQRTVLYLRYYEGLRPMEIAARLDVPLKTVKTRHTRAVAELRARLDARSGGDRRAWLSALLPGITPRASGPLGGVLIRLAGGLMMKKWGIAAVILVFVAGWVGVRGSLLERLGVRIGSRPVVQRLETPPAQAAPTIAVASPASRRTSAESAGRTEATGSLELRITWSDGTPAGGIGLDLTCANDPAPREERFRGFTDEGGMALVTGLFAGPIRVAADGRRFRGDELFLDAEVVAGATRAVGGSLAAGVDVLGRVLDAHGDPVPGAQVWGGFRSNRMPQVRLLGRSEQDGTFHLRELDAWRNTIGARATGYRPSPCFQAAELPVDGRGARTVILELGEGGGSVHGIVLDPEGRPLAGARVCGGPRGGHNLTLASGVTATAPQPAAVLTADDGTFFLPENLEAGVQPLYAQAHGYPTWRGEVEVGAGKAVAVEIRLEPGAHVEGRVVDAEGRPTGGVLVRAAKEDRGGWYWDAFPVSEDTSDQDGWFSLDWLAAGERELNASDQQRPDIGRARATVTCLAGATTTCELRLGHGLTIAGRVVDVDGRPLAGWRVSSTTTALTSWYSRNSLTDADGRFRLNNLGDCDHDISVRAPDLGHPRARVELVPTGTEDLEIVVGDAHVRTGLVRGRLVDATGGTLENLSLTLWKADGNEGHFQDFDPVSGEFEFEAIPGRFELHAMRGGRTLATSAVFEVREGVPTEVGELRIEPSGELELVVQGPGALDLEGLRPSLDRPGYSTVRPELEDDVFRVRAIAPGTWTLTTRAENWHLPPTVEVLAGVRTSLVLEAQATLPLRLEIARSDGKPIRELTVEARRPDGTLLRRDQRGYPEPHASVRWQLGLPPGPVSVEVRSGELAGNGSVILEAPFGSLAIALDVP